MEISDEDPAWGQRPGQGTGFPLSAKTSDGMEMLLAETMVKRTHLEKTIVIVQSLSRVRLFGNSWTVALQAPLSMDSLGKNTGVGCHFLLQGNHNSPIKISSLIVLEVRGPKWAKIKAWAGQLLLESPSSICFLPFPASRGTHIPELVAPPLSSPSAAQHLILPGCCSTVICSL